MFYQSNIGSYVFKNSNYTKNTYIIIRVYFNIKTYDFKLIFFTFFLC